MRWLIYKYTAPPRSNFSDLAYLGTVEANDWPTAVIEAAKRWPKWIRWSTHYPSGQLVVRSAEDRRWKAVMERYPHLAPPEDPKKTPS